MTDTTASIIEQAKNVILNKYEFTNTKEFWSAIVLPNIQTYARQLIHVVSYNYAYKKEIVPVKNTLPKFLVDM